MTLKGTSSCAVADSQVCVPDPTQRFHQELKLIIHSAEDRGWSCLSSRPGLNSNYHHAATLLESKVSFRFVSTELVFPFFSFHFIPRTRMRTLLSVHLNNERSPHKKIVKKLVRCSYLLFIYIQLHSNRTLTVSR